MERIIKILESWKTTAWLLIIYATGMAAATFIEAAHDTATARSMVYNSWWFYILHIILVANFVFISMRMQLWQRRRFGVIALHWGFVIIIIGAFITNIWGYEGRMHIREGETSSVIIIEDHFMKEVPFSITLKDFRLERYPGSNSPSSYESDVVINYEGEEWEQKIYMNNIARVGGFRIYQTSYDTDEQGTILTVNSDFTGTAVTYTGYFLLFLGLLWSLIEPGSRFRAIYKSLGKTGIATLLLLTASTFSAYGIDVRTAVDKSHAKKFGNLLIQSPDGRIEPVNSYSSEILRKLYHRNSYKGENPDQVLAGILSDPARWSTEPLIYVSIKEVAHELGATGKHLSYNEMFDENGNYRIEKEISRIYRKPPGERTKKDKEYIKLDEKVNILYSLFHGKMMPIFPVEGGKWLSEGDDLSNLTKMDSMVVAGVLDWHGAKVREGDYTSAGEALDIIRKYQTAKIENYNIEGHTVNMTKIKAEILYNKANIFRMAFRLYLILGFTLMILLISGHNITSPSQKTIKVIKIITALIIAVFAYHTFGIALRWYISGRAPWSNGYETMVYVAWATLLAGIIFIKKSKLVTALTTVLAGVILFVSNLNWLDPQITPLVPVLKSYWLMIHVSVITASYGFFGMCFMCGLASLIAIIFRRTLPDLRKINELSMNIGLVLLTAGIFFGAIWANESWGRYWGWDPKETWALITMVVYAFITHSHFLSRLNNIYAFSVMSVIGMISVAMTFFGVNYYLAGLHSYGGGGEVSFITVTIIILLLFTIIAAGGYTYKKTTQQQ